MFVCFWFGNVREVENVSGVEHCFSQCLLLVFVHAIEIDGHEQRTDLIVGYLAAGDARDKELDLFTRQALSVSLFSDNVLRSQAASSVALHKHDGLSGNCEPLPNCIESFASLGLNTHTAKLDAKHISDV